MNVHVPDNSHGHSMNLPSLLEAQILNEASPNEPGFSGWMCVNTGNNLTVKSSTDSILA